MTPIAREIAKRIGKLMEEEAKEFIEELEKEKEIAEAFRPKSSTVSGDSKIFKWQDIDPFSKILDGAIRSLREMAFMVL